MTRSPLVGLVMVVLAGACAESTVTTTSLPPATSIVTTTTTTTTTAASTTTTGPEPAEPGWIVTGVADNDVLNVRTEPDASAPKIGERGPHAIGVVTTGLGTPSHLAPGWWEVALDGGVTGWVNSKFLALSPLWTVPFSAAPCSTVASGPSPPATATADHVMALDYLEGEGCDRLVVLLGEHASVGPPDWPMTPASLVPGGVEVTETGSVISVHLPVSVHGVRPTATERAFGSAIAFVVRRPGDGGLDVNLHFDHNRSGRAFYLSDPARIAVDLTDAPTGTGLDLAPLVGALTVVAHPVNVDLGSPASLPVTVTGYSRPFEAQGAVELRTVATAPGSGTPVTARWDGDLGPHVGADYGFMTTDYAETWGSFAFTLVAVEPGTYELFVGEFSAKDGSPLGVYDQITLG